jgi:phosphoribosylformimino-5-aminoimidazole carboxamide ribotide isomerase
LQRWIRSLHPIHRLDDSVNHNAVAAIPMRRVPCSLAAAFATWRDRAVVEAGIARVILGTAAVRDPELVKSAARAFPRQVAVGIDARDGWLPCRAGPTTDMQAIELAKVFEGCGVAALIVTDISRDGLRAASIDFTGAMATWLHPGDRLGRAQECRRHSRAEGPPWSAH